MAGYLRRYIGTYRVVADYDLSTNDYIRLAGGELDPTFDDYYIPCKNRVKIFHHQRNLLSAYIPSLQRGRNILRALLAKELGLETIDFHKDILLKSNLIHSYQEMDFEVVIIFRSKDLEHIAPILQPRVAGANIGPFSKKNLPKKKYNIPLDNLQEYQTILKSAQRENYLWVSKATSEFLKKNKITDDKNRSRLRAKEYIHSVGLWDDFMSYLSSVA